MDDIDIKETMECNDVDGLSYIYNERQQYLQIHRDDEYEKTTEELNVVSNDNQDNIHTYGDEGITEELSYNFQKK